ncbi:MAG: TRAP transporter small permease, partial [Alphaproteobacteria bacterium]|nr:TRAP transporter small permease [Alphaproteobacteria bacterium]
LLDIFNSVLALIFFAGLAFAGWIMVGKSWFSPIGELRLEGTGTSWNPPTPALLKMLVLICVAIMFVQTLLHLIAAIRRDVSAPADIAEEK